MPLRDPVKLNEYNKWYEKNKRKRPPGYEKESSRKYKDKLLNDPERLARYRYKGSYASLTPEQHEEAKRKRREHARKTHLYQGCRARSFHQHLAFDLLPEDIIVPIICPLLGIPLIPSEGRVSENSPCVDRIDNTKGYTKDNIWIISTRANRIKNDATLEELKLLTSALEAKLHEIALSKLYTPTTNSAMNNLLQALAEEKLAANDHNIPEAT